MPYRITKEYVWFGTIPDHPGALAEKLRALSAGNLSLDLILSRREAPGRAALFVSPLRTMEELEIAAKAGFGKKDSVLTIRVAGPNTPGLGAKMAEALAEAGINIRAFTGAALGDQHVTCIMFDSAADVERAKEVLDRLLAD